MENPLEILEKEHEDIERELIEIDTIINSENINYSNLIHVFKKLCEIWNVHEEKEEKIFPIMEKERIKMPVHKMTYAHKDLRGHRKAILDAIDSGSEFQLRQALNTHMSIILEKLRAHMKAEDEILYTIALEEFTPKELRELWKRVMG